MAVGKKQKAENIHARLQLAIRSGKYCMGYKSCRKNMRLLKTPLIIVANNVPQIRRCEIEYYAMLSNSLVYYYQGNNVELGTACGKYFPISMMAIMDAGDSDIIKHVTQSMKTEKV